MLYYYRSDFTENRKSVDYISIFCIFRHDFVVPPEGTTRGYEGDHKKDP